MSIDIVYVLYIVSGCLPQISVLTSLEVVCGNGDGPKRSEVGIQPGAGRKEAIPKKTPETRFASSRGYGDLQYM